MYFNKEYIQMANKHTKRSQVPLVNREHDLTSVRCPLHPLESLIFF
jgi:hypothetical protein